jgi:uncharacterized protein (DUF1697 family)
MATFAVLFRAIGPATHRLITMRDLEEACRGAGLPDTKNLLATGNLVVRTLLSASRTQQIVLSLLAARGVQTSAVVCDASRIRALPHADPDSEASSGRPSQVQVMFLDKVPPDEAVGELRARASRERIERIGCDLWIDYGGPISQSRLTSTVIERVLGCTGTARNWNSILRLVAAVA